MNQLLKSELIQTLALADRDGYTQAVEFLLEKIHPAPVQEVIFGAMTQQTIRAAVNMAMYPNSNYTDRPQKLQGIKMYRTLTGAHLKEAKDWVEREFNI